MKAYYKTIGVEVLCGLFGKSRQAFYDRSRREQRQMFEQAIVVDLVKEQRQIGCRIGGKKLYLMLSPALRGHGLKIGRDRFLDVLRDNSLLVQPRRNRAKTTNSRHRFRKYKNTAKDVTVQKAEQLWVSDITYIRVGAGFCYLMLLTDAYSRKVVGYNFSPTLAASFCVKALQQALNNRVCPQRKLMHHSDRGIQYCSTEYTNLLIYKGIKISMTENGDPLENALAERMNGIFKDNFDLARNFDNFDQAWKVIQLAVNYYNNEVPHSSCDMLTPCQAHFKQGKLKKHWSKKSFGHSNT